MEKCFKRLDELKKRKDCIGKYVVFKFNDNYIIKRLMGKVENIIKRRSPWYGGRNILKVRMMIGRDKGRLINVSHWEDEWEFYEKEHLPLAVISAANFKWKTI